MKNRTHSSLRTIVNACTLLVALTGSALCVSATAAPATGTSKAERLADAKQALPLSAKFEKGQQTEQSAPYTLQLKNTSHDAVKVNVKVVLSVSFHGNQKNRDIANHEIKGGETWSISDLAAGDKITITADGYAALELTVH